MILVAGLLNIWTFSEDLLDGNSSDKVLDMVKTSLEERPRLTSRVDPRVLPTCGITVLANSTNAAGLG